MSVDTRLRTGLRAEAQRAPEVELVEAWADVVARHEHAHHTRRVQVVGALAAAAAIALVVVLLVRPGGDDGIQPAPSPTTSPTAGPTTAATEAAAPAPVEGKWTAGPVRAQRIVDHLETVGLGKWATNVLEGTRPDQEVSFRLVLQGGQLSLDKTVDGGVPANMDRQSYDLRGDSVVFTVQDGTCRTVLGWRVSDDTLRLRPDHGNCPDVLGITPDFAYTEALYGALPFTRLP